MTCSICFRETVNFTFLYVYKAQFHRSLSVNVISNLSISHLRSINAISLMSRTTKQRKTKEKHWEMDAIESKKKSFDRFPEQLVIVLVSFLPIQYKLSFECLSKTIKKSIFVEQDVLVINKESQFLLVDVPYPDQQMMITFRPYIDCDILAQILRKFKFLTKIEISDCIDFDSYLLITIANYCTKLTHLRLVCRSPEHTYSLTNESIVYFGLKCGPNLLSLSFSSSFSDENIKLLLHFTPKLQSLNCHSLNTILPEAQCCYKLDHLKKVNFANSNRNEVIRFQDIYCNTITKICLHTDESLGGFNRFHKLEVLYLNLQMKGNGFFYPALNLIAISCPLLKDLRIIGEIGSTKNRLFPEFGKFNNLEILGIKMIEDESVVSDYGSIEDLKGLTKLRHLAIDLNCMSDQTFDNISQHLPQLVSISINSGTHLTDKTLGFLAQLKSLQALKIFCGAEQGVTTFTDSGIERLLKKSHKFKSLELHCVSDDPKHNPMDVTLLTVREFAVKAVRNPKIGYRLIYDWGYDWQAINYIIHYKILPDNLTITRYE